MNKVITTSLNGNAYQLEEAGYDALRSYLDAAGAKLADNPDKEEIVRDLEQAIGDKLRRLMGAYKSVASGDDVAAVLKEMGPVDPSTESKTESAETNTKKNPEGVKRLYNITDGAIIGGVCNGIAAYFNIDVTVVRLAFVVLTIATSGVWVLIYFIMMVFVPYANTPEKIARAEGMPWNAQEIIDRAKAGYENLMTHAKKWEEKGHNKHWKHEMKQAWKQQMRDKNWGASAPANGPMSGLLTLLNVVLALGLALSIAALVSNHAILGLAIPAGMPLWIALVLLVIAYQLITLPIRAARFAAYGYNHERYYGAPDAGMYGVMDAVSWFGFFAIIIWALYSFVPATHPVLDHVWYEIQRGWSWVAMKIS